MNTLTEKKPICLEQEWDKYIKPAENLAFWMKMIYKASQKVEVFKAYKRTGDNPFFSTVELDGNISRYEILHRWLRDRARSKCIDIIPTI